MKLMGRVLFRPSDQQQNTYIVFEIKNCRDYFWFHVQVIYIYYTVWLILRFIAIVFY